MPRPHLGANRRLILLVFGLGVLTCLSLCLIAAPYAHARQVDFPNWDGSNILRTAHLSIGSVFAADGTYQPTSASYWIGAAFEWPSTSRVCRVGLRGWVRQQALTGEPLKLICDCRQPLNHNDQVVSCFEQFGLATSP